MLTRFLSAMAASSLTLALFLLIALVLRVLEIEPTTPVVALLVVIVLGVSWAAAVFEDWLCRREQRYWDAFVKDDGKQRPGLNPFLERDPPNVRQPSIMVSEDGVTWRAPSDYNRDDVRWVGPEGRPS